MSKRLFTELLSGNKVYGATALVIFLDHYGTEALAWHPETVAMELRSEFDSVSDAAFERLMAAIAVLTTDRFYRTVGGFIPIANALNWQPANSAVLNLPDALDCAWAITEARLISPPADSGGFDEAVAAYVARALRHEGVMTPPKSLVAVVDPDALSFDNSALTEDPLMFRAVYDSQSERAAAIDSAVGERLQDLLKQIEGLKLSNGSVENLSERLIGTLKRSAT